MKLHKITIYIKQNWVEIILGILVLIYAVVFSYYSIRRHMAFASGYDLANMDQTVWNTAHGNFFTVSGKETLISRFGHHADLILVLIAPFYWLYDSVNMLLIIQSVVIGLGAFPTYFLAKKVLQNKVKALVISVAYLLNWGVQWSNIYDFHGVTLAMTFLLSAFYFAYTRNWNWMFLFSFLALLTKENVSFFIIMLGLYVFFFLRDRVRGRLLVVGGIAWFVIMVMWLIPANSETGKYWVWDWFTLPQASQDGSVSAWQDLKSKLFSDHDISYYKSLIKPFGFLPLAGLPWLLLSGPEILINVSSEQGQMASMVFHYSSVVTVGLVIATIFGWKYISVFFKKYPIISWLIGVWILIATSRTFYHYGPLPTTPSYWRPMYTVTQDEIDFEKALQEVPKDAVITGSSEARAHLTHRRDAYTLPNIPDSVEYIAIVDQSRIVGDYSIKSFETGLVEKIAREGGWDLIFYRDHFYIFKKTN